VIISLFSLQWVIISLFLASCLGHIAAAVLQTADTSHDGIRASASGLDHQVWLGQSQVLE